MIGTIRRSAAACGSPPSRLRNWHAREQVCLASAEEAGLLDIPTGSPVIQLIHNATDEDGNILEVSESIRPSDRVIVIDDYDITQEAEDQAGMSDV
jgi:hypothetical protein